MMRLRYGARLRGMTLDSNDRAHKNEIDIFAISVYRDETARNIMI